VDRVIKCLLDQVDELKRENQELRGISGVGGPCFKLNSGFRMPLVGLGTWKSAAGQVEEAVASAIGLGYRHIDCAHCYDNEPEVAVGISTGLAKAGIKRKDLFVTSKLWNNAHVPHAVLPACQNTLKNLGLEYLDLYLIHWPVALEFTHVDERFPKNPDGSMRYDYTKFTDTWAEMEKLVAMGLCRSIGVSNFNSQQLTQVLNMCKIVPAVNQVESHPYFPNNELLAFMTCKGIAMTAYSPLGSGQGPPGHAAPMANPTIKAIGEKYGKSAAQVMIKFQQQRGVIVLPKSVTPARIEANYDIFDFELSQEDMNTLTNDLQVTLENGKVWRANVPTIEVDGKPVWRDAKHPLFPFHFDEKTGKDLM